MLIGAAFWYFEIFWVRGPRGRRMRALPYGGRLAVEVIAYVDDASGTMEEDGTNGGRFVEVVLRPTVTIADAAQTVKAQELHAPAHKKCFVANSVNFPVRVEATIAASG